MREQIKKLVLGNGLAQLLQFGSILVLSRIYQPSDFGLLAQVQSIAMLGSILLTLQLHLIIPLSQTEETALKIVQQIQMLSLILFLAALLPSILLGACALYALVLSLFLGLTNTYIGYLIYSRNFGKMSTFYVVRALLIITMQIGFVYIKLENGLVMATLVGEGLSMFYLRAKKINFPEEINTKFEQIKVLVLNNKPFALYGTIQEIVSVSAVYAPLLLFSAKYGEAVGGQYAMASRLVWAPIILISGSYAQVLLGKFGKLLPTSHDEILKLLPSSWIMVTLIFFCWLTFMFNDLTLFLIGDKWVYASQMIPLQMLWGLIFMMSIPYRVLIRVFRLQKYQLLIDFFMMVIFYLIIFVACLKPVQALLGMIFMVILQNFYLIKVVIFSLNKVCEVSADGV